MTDAYIIAAVPLTNGGRRTVAVSDGTGLVFTQNEGSSLDAALPELSFDALQAVEIARRVLGGHERTVTAPETLRVLAAAVVLLDHQLTPEFVSEGL